MFKNNSPLVEKAFKDVGRIMGFPIVEELANLMGSAFSFIETDIDRPQEEKEALKAALVLYFGAPYMRLDQDQMAAEYGPLVAEMVSAATGPQGSSRSLVGVKDENVAQMSMALRCATMQAGSDDLRLDFKDNPEEVLEMREELHEIKTNPAVMSAPRLLARMEQIFEGLVEDAPTSGNSPSIEFGKINVPRTPNGPSDLPDVGVPHPPKGPSKKNPKIGIPRPPK